MSLGADHIQMRLRIERAKICHFWVLVFAIPVAGDTSLSPPVEVDSSRVSIGISAGLGFSEHDFKYYSPRNCGVFGCGSRDAEPLTRAAQLWVGMKIRPQLLVLLDLAFAYQAVNDDAVDRLQFWSVLAGGRYYSPRRLLWGSATMGWSHRVVYFDPRGTDTANGFTFEVGGGVDFFRGKRAIVDVNLRARAIRSTTPEVEAGMLLLGLGVHWRL